MLARSNGRTVANGKEDEGSSLDCISRRRCLFESFFYRCIGVRLKRPTPILLYCHPVNARTPISRAAIFRSSSGAYRREAEKRIGAARSGRLRFVRTRERRLRGATRVRTRVTSTRGKVASLALNKRRVDEWPSERRGSFQAMTSTVGILRWHRFMDSASHK